MEVKRTEQYVHARSMEFDLPDDASVSTSTPRGQFGTRLPREGFLPQLAQEPPASKVVFNAARHAEKLHSIKETPAMPPSEFKHSKKPRLRMDKVAPPASMRTVVLLTRRGSAPELAPARQAAAWRSGQVQVSRAKFRGLLEP